MKHAPGFVKIVEDAKSRVNELTVADYAQMVKGDGTHVLVDVREESEWTAGHAAGAIHLGKGIIERDVEGKIPDPATRIVLYCGGGFRSALAADALQKMGYQDVYSLAGGWRAWNEAQMPVEK